MNYLHNGKHLVTFQWQGVTRGKSGLNKDKDNLSRYSLGTDSQREGNEISNTRCPYDLLSKFNVCKIRIISSFQ